MRRSCLLGLSPLLLRPEPILILLYSTSIHRSQMFRSDETWEEEERSKKSGKARLFVSERATLEIYERLFWKLLSSNIVEYVIVSVYLKVHSFLSLPQSSGRFLQLLVRSRMIFFSLFLVARATQKEIWWWTLVDVSDRITLHINHQRQATRWTESGSRSLDACHCFWWPKTGV